MSQIDYFLKFTDRATAMADAVASLQTITDGQGIKQWLLSNCVEVTVWRASQDTTSTDANGNTVVTHTPLPGFFVLISLDRVVNELLNHAAVQLVVDRDKMNARTPGFVLKSGVTNAVLQDIRISPVFAGTNAPWGALN